MSARSWFVQAANGQAEVSPCIDDLVDERLAVTCDDAPYTEGDPECITRLSRL